MKTHMDEMFVLHHLDLGLDEEEIEDMIEDSSLEQRLKWLKENGYEVSKHD